MTPGAGWTDPVVLEGRHVRLEPLAMEHLAALCEAGLDPELWALTVSRGRDRDEMRAFVERALAEQMAGTALPFALVDRACGRVAGSTRYGNLDARNRRVEVGWTWLGRAWQRTALNSEVKLLLLRHAFEERLERRLARGVAERTAEATTPPAVEPAGRGFDAAR